MSNDSFCRLREEQDEPSSPTLASVPLIHNIPELKVSQEVYAHYLLWLENRIVDFFMNKIVFVVC